MSSASRHNLEEKKQQRAGGWSGNEGNEGRERFVSGQVWNTKMIYFYCGRSQNE